MKINSLTVTKRSLASAILLTSAVLAPSTFGARALIYELDHRFSGAVIPNTNPPWAVATFLQVDNNTVELHMRANDIGNGYINNWWFNFEGSAANLQIMGISASVGTTQPTFSYAGGSNAALFNNGRDSIRWDLSMFSGANQDFKSNDDIYVSFYSASGLSIDQFNSSIGAGAGPNMYSGANINSDAGTTKIVDLAPRYEENVTSPPHFDFAAAPEASSVFLGFVLLAGCVGSEVVRRKREAALATIPVSAN
jgi:hypothetical protein